MTKSNWIFFFSTVSLTLDPSTAHRTLKVTQDLKRVYYTKACGDPTPMFPHVLSKEALECGQHYWEVMLWDKASSATRKASWCVGVTQKQNSHSEHVFRALCYEGGGKARVNPGCSEIAVEYGMQVLGLYLNCEEKTLSFYNANKTSDNLLYTFNNVPQGQYFAFFSPGDKDHQPIKIHESTNAPKAH